MVYHIGVFAMGSVSLTLVNIEQRVHPDMNLKYTLMSRFLQTCLMSSLILEHKGSFITGGLFSYS